MVNMEQWSSDQVLFWLRQEGFESYEEIFRSNEVTGDVLITLTNEIMRDDLNISVYGHRVKILRAIRNLLQKSKQKTTYIRVPHETNDSTTCIQSNIVDIEQIDSVNISTRGMQPTESFDPNLTLYNRPSNLPTVPKIGRLKFYNTKIGKDIRLNQSYQHIAIREKPGSCIMCFSDSTSGRRREMKTTKKCCTCQVYLCTKKFGSNEKSCFESFHEMDILAKLERPPPRPTVMYILPNWDPTKDSYESLKREVQNRPHRDC